MTTQPAQNDAQRYLDPAKVEAGRKGGLKTANRHLAHLSEVEREVLRELEYQARAYRGGTAGAPLAVAAWLRLLAERLEKAR